MNCEQLCGFYSDTSVMRDGRLLDSHPHHQNFISTPNQNRLLSYTPYVRHTCFPLFFIFFLGYFSWGALIIMELELGFQRRCREREMLSVSANILCLLDSLHAMPFTWWIFVFKDWVKWEALDTLYIIGNQKILKSKSDVYHMGTVKRIQFVNFVKLKMGNLTYVSAQNVEPNIFFLVYNLSICLEGDKHIGAPCLFCVRLRYST